MNHAAQHPEGHMIGFQRIAVPMAVDGLVLDVPDTSANDEAFGRSGNDTAAS